MRPIIIAILIVFISRSFFSNQAADTSSSEQIEKSDAIGVYSSSIIRVLITRTVSPSETSIVATDVAYVKSFYSGQQHILHLEKSKSHCNQLKSHYDGILDDPYKSDSSIFPNYLLCMNASHGMEDNFFSRVEADFMLFARSTDHVEQLQMEIEKQSSLTNQTNIYHHNVDIDIRDVSSNPKKIYNWVIHADRDRLLNYDYIWFIDGDIKLKSLNWQAFWKNVHIMKPKISQPSMIGGNSNQPGTTWTTLRYQSDARLIAAEVPIVELGVPLLEVETWLKYRDIMFNNPSVMNDLRLGGENCFDMGWCHLAKTNMTGQQQRGKMWDKDIGYGRGIEMDMSTNSTMKGRACMVFYQTPLQHITKGTFVRDSAWATATANVCKFLREEKGVFGKGGSWTVYELFNFPNDTGV